MIVVMDRAGFEHRYRTTAELYKDTRHTTFPFLEAIAVLQEGKNYGDVNGWSVKLEPKEITLTAEECGLQGLASYGAELLSDGMETDLHKAALEAFALMCDYVAAQTFATVVRMPGLDEMTAAIRSELASR